MRKDDPLLSAEIEAFREKVNNTSFNLDLSKFSNHDEVWEIRPFKDGFDRDDVIASMMQHKYTEATVKAVRCRAFINGKRRWLPRHESDMMKIDPEFWDDVRSNMKLEEELFEEPTVEELEKN